MTSNNDVRIDRAVFLDRDGTIVEDVGYLTSLAKLKILEGSIEGLRLLREHFLIVLVTNQSAVARRLMDVNDLLGIHQTLAELLQEKGAGLDAIYSCPHLPETECNCRKPRPGMILSAHSTFHINLDRSSLIGDKLSDIVAGQRAKIPVTILVKSPKTDITILQNVQPTRIVDNLFEASQYVLNHQR